MHDKELIKYKGINNKILLDMAKRFYLPFKTESKRFNIDRIEYVINDF
jgi:hypothetical protein